MPISRADSDVRISLGDFSIGVISRGDTVVYGKEPPAIVPPRGLSLIKATTSKLTVQAYGPPPTGFGTVIGFNFYRAEHGDTLVKINSTPHGDTFVHDELDDATEYDVAFTYVKSGPVESAKFGTITVSTLPPTPDPPMAQDDIDALDEIVQQAFLKFPARSAISLSIAGERGVFQRAYGSSGGRANSLDHHFRMGSGSKSFTALAIMMMVHAGLMSLDDHLSDFVCGAGIANAENITIRQMLMMRSGIFDYTMDTARLQNVYLNYGFPFTVADALTIMQSRGSQFTPGTAFQYSNSNFVLCGLIVEELTGKPIRDFINEDICEPLGLYHTSWPYNAVMPEPYMYGVGDNLVWLFVYAIPIIGPFLVLLGLFGTRYRSETFWNPNFFGAAGGMVTNLDNLHKWAEYLREGTGLISEELHEEWQTTYLPIPGVEALALDEQWYGMGWFKIEAWKGALGSVPGYTCLGMYLPGSRAIIAAAENFQTPGALIEGDVFAPSADHLYPGSVTDGDGYVYEPPPEIGEVLTYVGTVIDADVPEGYTHFRTWLIGHGGGPGGGQRLAVLISSSCPGAGGGGAGVIDTGIQPIGVLGDTFSQVEGTGGLPGMNPVAAGPGISGTDGTASTFDSGDVHLSAGGGEGGEGGRTDDVPAAGGAGGVAEAEGITGLEVVADGTAGADGKFTKGDTPPPNTDGGAGGGGSGGGGLMFWNGFAWNVAPAVGGDGGNSIYQAGSIGGRPGSRDGVDTAPTLPGTPGAGAGGGMPSYETGTDVPGDGGAANGYGAGGGGGPVVFDPAYSAVAGPSGPAYVRTDFYVLEE